MANIVEFRSKQFPLGDEGIHQAVLVDVQDLGMVATPFGPKAKVLFFWAVEQCDDKGQPILVPQRFTKSLHPSSRLYVAIQTVTGKQPGRRLDLDDLIGLNALLTISHVCTGERTFMNVASLNRVPTGQTWVAIPATYRRKKDRANGQPPWAGPTKLVRVPPPCARPESSSRGLTAEDFAEAPCATPERGLADVNKQNAPEITEEDVAF